MRIKILRHGGCKLLAEKFTCTPQKVSYALNFKRNSMGDAAIRHYAMNELEGIIL